MAYRLCTGRSPDEALSTGPGAVLSHQTAAERHGLIDEPSPVITITVPTSRNQGRTKIPGIVIHRSDAVLQTRHPAMLPPCTRVEDTVLDLIGTAANFDDAYGWICRAVGRRRTTAERIQQAMNARKKMRWRAELTLALNGADAGVLSVLEYRYVHRVERPHGLPAARRQARIRHRTGNRYLDNLYEDYGVCVELDGTGWPDSPHPCARPACSPCAESHDREQNGSDKTRTVHDHEAGQARWVGG